MSQANKNLGRMNASDEEIAAKLGKWQSFYRNEGVETAIQRNSTSHGSDRSAVASQTDERATVTGHDPARVRRYHVLKPKAA